MNGLIGFSGFVGNTLLKQYLFERLYRSTNIQDIRNQNFDVLVCAGAPAQKWLANKEPEVDLKQINSLIDHLRKVEAKQFILISTVDVFKNPQGVNEDSDVDESGLHPYGLHRRLLEKFVQQHFENHLIVRLPGLVGPGLKKNVIYDFLNHNNLTAIDSRGIFQFYPMVNLWQDIQIAIHHKLQLIHLTSEAVSVSDVASHCFNLKFENIPSESVAASRYDMQTRYAKLFNSLSTYQYSAKEVFTVIRAYAQSEPLTLNQ